MKGIHTKTRGAREYPPAAGEREKMSSLRLAVEAALRFAAALLLANANVFGVYSPFAVGFVAASGASITGAASLAGAVIGYTINMGFIGGLQYTATVIVMFFVMYIMRDMEIYRSRAFSALTAAIVTCAIGIVQLLSDPASLMGAVYFVSETVLAGGCAYFYVLAAEIPASGDEEPRDLRHAISLLILCATLIIPLSEMTLFAGVSVGRLMAVLAVMTGAYYGGIGAGTATGTALGIALDISAMGVPFFTMAYAFSGLVAGIFKKQGRLGVIIAYILANAVSVLWMWEYTLRTTVLFEVFIASVVFAVLPGKVISLIGEFAVSRETASDKSVPASTAKKKIEKLSGVFTDLQDAIKRVPVRQRPNDNDLASVYDSAAEQVCRKCPLMYHCWQKDYQSTLTAMNDAGKVLMERGKLTNGDFPQHFAARCVNYDKLVPAINSEFEKMLRRRQARAQTRENREIIVRQYGDIAKTLNMAAKEMGEDNVRDETAQRRIEKYLRGMEISAEVSVFRDGKGRLKAEIKGDDLEKIINKDLRENIAKTIKTPVAEPEIIKTPLYQKIAVTQSEPLAAAAATAAKRCTGQSVSGDSCSYLKSEDGKLYVLLADGMGSGEEAHRESELVIHLLEKLLSAGVTPAYALKTLNTTMLLREDMLVSTVDMLAIDLFTGETELFKYGAAPTYVRRGGGVDRFEGHALSVGAGIEPMESPEVARIRMGEGDAAVVLSDGVTDGSDDEWLKHVLMDYHGSSPKELSQMILDNCPDAQEPHDDMTVLAVILQKRQN